jgi:hypothetical protein
MHSLMSVFLYYNMTTLSRDYIPYPPPGSMRGSTARMLISGILTNYLLCYHMLCENMVLRQEMYTLREHLGSP